MLHRSALLLVLLAALTAACGRQGPDAKTAVGTTTVTSAPMVPDQPFPLALLEETPEEAAAAAEPVLETWGVRPPTPQELEEFGF